MHDLVRARCGHRYRTFQRDVLRRASNENAERSRRDVPLLRSRVKISEGPSIEIHGDVLRLSRLECDLRKTLQLLGGTGNLRMIVRNVDLGDFCPGAVSGVCEVERDRVDSIFCTRDRSNRQVRVLERGIAKAVAERK